MIIARSLWRKAIVTVVAAAAFVSLYEVTMLDSQNAARQAVLRETTAAPFPRRASRIQRHGLLQGGRRRRLASPRQTGVAASDPQLLPVGSVIEIDSAEVRYSGIYTIMDTGPSVQGRQIDIYMWSCTEALSFGRRPVHLVVLRLGWNPHATIRGLAAVPSRQLLRLTQEN